MCWGGWRGALGVQPKGLTAHRRWPQPHSDSSDWGWESPGSGGTEEAPHTTWEVKQVERGLRAPWLWA
jgi:hypothetical protein